MRRSVCLFVCLSLKAVTFSERALVDHLQHSVARQVCGVVVVVVVVAHLALLHLDFDRSDVQSAALCALFERLESAPGLDRARLRAVANVDADSLLRVLRQYLGATLLCVIACAFGQRSAFRSALVRCRCAPRRVLQSFKARRSGRRVHDIARRCASHRRY